MSISAPSIRCVRPANLPDPLSIASAHESAIELPGTRTTWCTLLARIHDQRKGRNHGPLPVAKYLLLESPAAAFGTIPSLEPKIIRVDSTI